jgi:hypothetical protein
MLVQLLDEVEALRAAQGGRNTVENTKAASINISNGQSTVLEGDEPLESDETYKPHTNRSH